MRRLLTMLAVVVAVSPPAAGAGEYLVLDWVQRGRSWAELQGPYRPEETMREGLALLQREFGEGVIWGVTATGGRCAQRFSGEEFAAYMRSTARPSDRFEDAVQTFLTARGCRGRADEVDSIQRAVDALDVTLSGIRFETDQQELRAMVERGGAPGATAWQRVVGLVAGARLLELETQGRRPPAFRPGESGPR